MRRGFLLPRSNLHAKPYIEDADGNRLAEVNLEVSGVSVLLLYILYTICIFISPFRIYYFFRIPKGMRFMRKKILAMTRKRKTPRKEYSISKALQMYLRFHVSCLRSHH